jgi:hypothetical protein
MIYPLRTCISAGPTRIRLTKAYLTASSSSSSHCCSELHARAHRTFSSAIFPSTPYRSATDLTRSGRNVPLSISLNTRTACLLSIDISNLPTCSTLIFWHLGRYAESMTKLSLISAFARHPQAPAYFSRSVLPKYFGDTLRTDTPT